MPEISKLNLDGTSRDIKDASAFRTDDTAETTISDSDYFPFYDASASSKKKTLWSNIIDVLKNTFAIKSHASTATTYGVGTTSNYGHVKTIDNLSKTSLTNGESLSAHMGNALGTMAANIETSSSASQAYVKGDFLIFNNQFCRTTKAISENNTLAIGTNLENLSFAYLFKDIYTNLLENSFEEITVGKDQGSTVSTTSGTVATCVVVLIRCGSWLINVQYCDIRMSDLAENNRPTITITDEALRPFRQFHKTLPSGARGGASYSTCFPTDGGALVHPENTNTLQVTFMSYFVPLKSGYLTIHV